jgi:hypothetical protein
MRLYIQRTNVQGAWKWINEGYRKAWKQAGFDVIEYNDILEVDSQGEYDLMAWEYDIRNRPQAIEVIGRANRAYLYVQPNEYPAPWGNHPNWITSVADTMIEQINKMSNVHLWNFSSPDKDYFHKWKDVNEVPLAFDSISYIPEENRDYSDYDICFVGGWANNGYNEKREIMINTFSKFIDSKLKCGFFINKGLTIQQECDLLRNSKMCLNIHDAYQRSLGFDTNERTFKSLGLNGLLVSDTVGQLTTLFPNVQTSLDTTQIVNIVEEQLSLSDDVLDEIRYENRKHILDNHCYTNRVEDFIKL